MMRRGLGLAIAIFVSCGGHAGFAQSATASGDSTPVVKAPATPVTRHSSKHHGKTKPAGPRTPTAQDAADAAALAAKVQAAKDAAAAKAAKAAALAVEIAKDPSKAPKSKLPADVGPVTGMHLPRYAALKSDAVNLHKGPGMKYPIEWVYQRRDLPVRIEREFDIWRLVEDMDHVKGWVQTGMLNGHRSFVVTSSEAAVLRSEASDDSQAVAKLMPGVVGRIKFCEANSAWCMVQTGGYKGFLARAAFYGAEPNEVIQP